MVTFLDYCGPKVCEIRAFAGRRAKQSNTCFFEKKRRKKKSRRTPALFAFELLDRDIDEFRLIWEYSQYCLKGPLLVDPLSQVEPGTVCVCWFVLLTCHMNKTTHTVTTASIAIDVSGKGTGG